MGRPRVGLIDYGGGNLHSVVRALEHGGAEVDLASDAAAIERAERLLLPGVSAFGASMGQLRRRGLEEAVLRALESKPFLGICVGLQLLLEGSDEDPEVPGLGHLPGRCRKFRPGPRSKVPHMGWTATHGTGRSHPLLRGLPETNWFYYAHSYHLDGDSPDALATATLNDGTRMTAALARGNVAATQFHPEKSMEAGLRLYANFIAWDGG